MGDLGRQMLLAGVEQRVATVGVLQAQVDKPVQVSRVTPVLIQELEKDDLGDTTGVLRGDLEVADEAFNHLLGSNDPSDSGTRSDNL